MSLHDYDCLFAAVVAALGETIASSVVVGSTSTVVRPAVSRRGRARYASEMLSISRPMASTGRPAMTLGFVAMHGG